MKRVRQLSGITRSKILFRSISVTAVFLFLSACSPGLNASLRVSRIPTSENAPRNMGGVALNVGLFTDARSTGSIARINGREVKVEGDVGLSVQQAIERQLKIQGAKLSLFNSSTIRGAVKEWRVLVKPDFPTSKADAKATITVELLDAKGKKLYNGIYSGNMSVEDPVMRQDRVEDILGEAMLNAINRFLNDPRFTSKLKRSVDAPVVESQADAAADDDLLEPPPLAESAMPLPANEGEPETQVRKDQFRNQRPSDVNF